jgi:hypothetical protein
MHTLYEQSRVQGFLVHTQDACLCLGDDEGRGVTFVACIRVYTNKCVCPRVLGPGVPADACACVMCVLGVGATT